VEFVHFITSLRLIRNYESPSLGNQHVKLKLNPEYRYEITGVEDPAVHFDTAWTPHFFPKTGWCCSFSTIWSIIESFAYKRVEVPQSVTSMMLPLRKSSSLESLALFVEVSTALNNVTIFDCPVGIYSLHYFWDQHGRSTHLMNFAKYVISLATFILCLFANDFHYTASDRSVGDNVGVAVLNAVMIAMFAYYFYDEFGQCRSKYNQLQDKVAKTDRQVMAKSGGAKRRLAKLASFALTNTNTDLRASSFHAFLISHFLFDLWNAFDLVIVCTGIAGLSMRFIYHEDKPGGRVLFAITSVLMWFKTLYFMRPFAASGPLGESL
jgi:hypothetical protein